MPRDKREEINREKFLFLRQLNANSPVLRKHNAKPPLLDPKVLERLLKNFTTKCREILDGSPPSIMDEAIKLGYAALVTVLTASLFFVLGFSIGFLFGVWTGPGAFITACMAASMSAHMVVASSLTGGILAGGFSLYNLFKPSKELAIVKTFTEEIRKSSNGLCA